MIAGVGAAARCRRGHSVSGADTRRGPKHPRVIPCDLHLSAAISLARRPSGPLRARQGDGLTTPALRIGARATGRGNG